MAIAFVNLVETNNTSAVSTLTVNMPSYSTGDLVIICLCGTNSVDPAGTHSHSGGYFTEIDPVTTGGINITSVSAVRMSVWYRIMQSGDSASYDFQASSTQGFTARAASYSGVDPSTPINIANSSTGGADTSAICPTVTTDEDGCYILRMVAQDDQETHANAGVTIRGATSVGISTPGNGTNCDIGDTYQASQGSTGTSTYTLGASEEWGTFTVAINPVLVSYALSGVTKDKNGSTLASCECFLVQDNGGDTMTFIDQTTSDGSGNYSFTGLSVSTGLLVIAWKDNTPHVFDATDHVLTASEE